MKPLFLVRCAVVLLAGVAALAGTVLLGAAAAETSRNLVLTPPKNILVNDPSADVFPNISQYEPSIAVFGSNIVVGWNDTGSSATTFAGFGSGLGYGFSSDGGATFTDGGALKGGGLGGSSWGADPTLAVDRAGNFYFGRFALISTSPSRGAAAGVTVYKSTDRGATFQQTVPAFGTGVGTADKPFLVVDNSGGPRDGTIYLAWMEAQDPSYTIIVARSTDGGATFPLLRVVSPSGRSFGAMPAIGPNGELYVTWKEIDSGQINFRRSTDGGATWDPVVRVTTVNNIGIPKAGSANVLNGDFRASNFPIIAVDTSTGPARGSIYLVIGSAPVAGGPDVADVYLQRSTDGGNSWTAPKRLNDDATTNDQWLPFVAVAPNGVVAAMWYDRRLDSQNYLIDVYLTASSDGGATFVPNFRITDTSFPVPRFSPKFDPLAPSGYMSSYNFMTADATGFYLVWTDNRLVNSGVPDPNIFFAKVPFAPALPVIMAQPVAQTVASGASVVFRIEATGAASYQWRRNGVNIAGGTSATLVVQDATASSQGNYSVAVSNSVDTAMSNAAALVVTTTNDPGRLINLSVLTSLTSLSDNFSLGYVVSGASASNPKPVVIRAAGPSLGALGFPGTVDDPKFELFAGATKTGGNEDWGGTSTIINAMAAVGAFAYVSPTSRDAAAFANITASDNSVKVSAGASSVTGAGWVIAEVYDAGGADTGSSPKLKNFSVIKSISAGGYLTLGFTIGGSTAETVLIRAVGPGLAAVGLASGTLGDPQLTLYNSSSTVIASNDDWGADSQLSVQGARAGAFSVGSAATKDAMLIITLPPGGYSARATANSNTSGTAIVEIYEVP